MINTTIIEQNITIASAQTGLFSFLNSFFNALFGPIILKSPFWGLVLISLLLTFFITLIYKYATNQAMMKQLKNEIKQHQKEAKDHKHDPKKMMEIQKVSMEKNLKYMMHSFKPMIITFIPLIIMFGWMRMIYKGVDLNFLGILHSWLWVYIIFSVIFSITIRKAMKVY